MDLFNLRFSIYVHMYAAGLAVASSTTEEHVSGVMAHMFLMVQLSRDLGDSHWLYYDGYFQ